jgi:hypothetical protein
LRADSEQGMGQGKGQFKLKLLVTTPESNWSVRSARKIKYRVVDRPFDRTIMIQATIDNMSQTRPNLVSPG